MDKGSGSRGPTLGGLDMTDAHGDMTSPMYLNEFNDLRIEKLNNRFTILAFLLPCLVAVVVFFAWLDVKDRLSSLQNSGLTTADNLMEDVDAKLNEMTIRLAKLALETDTVIPEMAKEIDNTKAELGKIAAQKVDQKTLAQTLETLESLKNKIAANDNRYKEIVHIIDRTSNETLSILNEKGDALRTRVEKLAAETDENRQAITVIDQQVSKTVSDIESQAKLMSKGVKEALDTSSAGIETILKTLDEYDHSIATLRKDLSLIEISIRDLRQNTLEKRYVDEKISRLETEFTTLLDNLLKSITENGNRPVKQPSTGLKSKQESPTPLPSSSPSGSAGNDPAGSRSLTEKALLD